MASTKPIAVRIVSIGLLILLGVARVWADTGTVMPTPKFTGFDNNGLVISSGRLCTYAAGTSTPQPTYSDVGLTTANTNPVVLDPSGRATVFLSSTSYKFVLRAAGGTLTGNTAIDCAATTLLWSQDNVGAIPTTSAGVDVLCTAGEALTAGQAAYWSDGSGGKNAGQCYKADSANTYSSTTPAAGLAPAAISSGALGTVRIQGQVTGVTVATGSKYYVGSAGAITTTPPTNARFLGQADSVTSIVLQQSPSATTNQALTTPVITTPAVTAGTFAGGTFTSPTMATSIVGPFTLGCGVRLTLTAGTPVTTADVTGAATIYATPYANGGWGAGVCAFYDGSATWTTLTFTETSIPLGTLTSGKPYDVFCYNSSGTMACELLVWTSDTVRATALVLQNGILVKTGATTRRYIGTFYTTSTTTTEDSVTKRYVWNYYNRVPRLLYKIDATASWVYSNTTIRQARADATNQVEVVIGVSEAPVDMSLSVVPQNDTGAQVRALIGVDSTTAGTTNVVGGGTFVTATSLSQVVARGVLVLAAGRHTITWLEQGGSAGATTWHGSDYQNSGLIGRIDG